MHYSRFQLLSLLFHPKLYYTLLKLKLLVLDVDGVLTDGLITYDTQGQISRSFHVHDGLGLKILQETDISVLVISGGVGSSIDTRLRSLDIRHYATSVKDKLSFLQHFQQQYQLSPSETIYIGDDLNDLAVLPAVAHFLAPANAHPFVKRKSDYILSKNGGSGAVREAIDLILHAHGLYESYANGWFGTN